MCVSVLVYSEFKLYYEVGTCTHLQFIYSLVGAGLGSPGSGVDRNGVCGGQVLTRTAASLGGRAY